MGLAGAAGEEVAQFPPDHEADELVHGAVFGSMLAGVLAVPQHHHPVGDLEHLVQLVRDEDDRDALGLELALSP